MKKSYKHKMIVGLALTTLAGTSVMSLSAPAFLNNVIVAHPDSSAIADNINFNIKSKKKKAKYKLPL